MVATRILGHLHSEGAVCHVLAKKHLTGRWWQEVFAFEEKCSPKGKGDEIKFLSGLKALWNEKIFFPKGFFSF